MTTEERQTSKARSGMNRSQGVWRGGGLRRVWVKRTSVENFLAWRYGHQLRQPKKAVWGWNVCWVKHTSAATTWQTGAYWQLATPIVSEDAYICLNFSHQFLCPPSLHCRATAKNDWVVVLLRLPSVAPGRLLWSQITKGVVVKCLTLILGN